LVQDLFNLPLNGSQLKLIINNLKKSSRTHKK
jgi:hypothetical protein